MLNAEQCQNGGTCIEVDGTNLECDCPSDTTGQFCEEGKFICRSYGENSLRLVSDSGLNTCVHDYKIRHYHFLL